MKLAEVRVSVSPASSTRTLVTACTTRGSGVEAVESPERARQIAATAIIDQRKLAVRIVGQSRFVAPGRHPEYGVGQIEIEPGVPVTAIEIQRLR